MVKNRKFLMIAIPLAIILLGLTVYEYGYLYARSEVSALKKAALDKRRLLRKYLTLIADKPRIEADLTMLTAVRETERAKTIEGQTPSIAAAAMQNTVKGLITARGGYITSERIEKAEDMENFKKITISVDATLPDIRALSDTLFTIETQTPYLVVREVDASIRNYMAPKEITIRLKISGLTGGK